MSPTKSPPCQMEKPHKLITKRQMKRTRDNSVARHSSTHSDPHTVVLDHRDEEQGIVATLQQEWTFFNFTRPNKLFMENTFEHSLRLCPALVQDGLPPPLPPPLACLRAVKFVKQFSSRLLESFTE